jgi:hypothetical protein
MTLVAEHIVDDAAPHNYTDEEYEHATRVALPVMIAKADCVTHQAFCSKQNIMAYPTLRLFVDGNRWKGELIDLVFVARSPHVLTRAFVMFKVAIIAATELSLTWPTIFNKWKTPTRPNFRATKART